MKLIYFISRVFFLPWSFLNSLVHCATTTTSHGKEKKMPIVTWHISKKTEASNNPRENRHFEMETTDLTKLMSTLNQIQIRCDQLQH